MKFEWTDERRAEFDALIELMIERKKAEFGEKYLSSHVMTSYVMGEQFYYNEDYAWADIQCFIKKGLYKSKFDYSKHEKRMDKILSYFDDQISWGPITRDEKWLELMDIIEDQILGEAESNYDSQQESLMSDGPSSSSNRYPTTLSEYMNIKECRNG